MAPVYDRMHADIQRREDRTRPATPPPPHRGQRVARSKRASPGRHASPTKTYTMRVTSRAQPASPTRNPYLAAVLEVTAATGAADEALADELTEMELAELAEAKREEAELGGGADGGRPGVALPPSFAALSEQLVMAPTTVQPEIRHTPRTVPFHVVLIRTGHRAGAVSGPVLTAHGDYRRWVNFWPTHARLRHDRLPKRLFH